MMVETCLDSSQDFGMSNGSLPQWKRELLQRRAARSRPAPAPAPAPPPPPPPPPPLDDDNDEELRYGPGIVKRLKSRYLSLALRDAPRRRPSVLRRATSLEHLLDERPPPAPRAPRAPRPASVATRPAPLDSPARRESVKRARSVDALSRLEAREEPPLPPAPAPRPPGLRAARPPRRPTPLLRDTERPPPDVVRSTLRKFESAPPRRPAPAARVSAVLRGLEGTRRSITPDRSEPEPRSPTPSLGSSDAPPLPSTPPPALSSPVESPSPSPAPPSSPPPVPVVVSVSNVVTPPIAVSPPFAAVVAPVRAKTPECDAIAPPSPQPVVETVSRGSDEPECAGGVRAVSRAALEGIARAGCTVRYAFETPRAASHLPPLAATNPVLVGRRVGVIRPMPASPRAPPASPPLPPAVPAPDKAPEEPVEEVALVNGHSTPEPRVLSRIGAAGIERAWSGTARRVLAPGPAPAPAPAPAVAPSWARGPGRARAPPPAATSIVFNFSNRKEVPDYIENDGIILRASRRNRVKAGEPGVVVLRPEAARGGSDSEGEEEEGAGEGGPPSPCAVRFVNDNVLINGRSSMPQRLRRDPHRTAKLKLQFDDSLTRTFEYPSETSLCEDSPADTAPAPPPASALAPVPAPAPAPAPTDAGAHLADNTHIASAALSRYTPSKTPPGAFQLGVTSPPAAPPAHAEEPYAGCGGGAEGAGAEERAHAVPCGADAARSWSEARLATDLLF